MIQTAYESTNNKKGQQKSKTRRKPNTNNRKNANIEPVYQS